MEFSPNEVQRMLQASAAIFAADRAGAVRSRFGSGAAEPGADWTAMADLGWLAFQLPEEDGGIDGGPLEAMILCESLGRIASLEPFLGTAVLGARAVVRHGTAAQQRALFPRLAGGGLRVAWVCNGDDPGEDAARLAIRAVRVDGGFVLDGQQRCVFDGAGADCLLVAARIEGAPDDAIGWFLVDAARPGVEARHFARLDGGLASHFRFVGVDVAAAERLGAPGEGAAVWADLRRLGMAAACAQAVGAMQALHDRTLEYLKTRQQFGRPIGQFQVLQHRQVDMLIALEQARSIVTVAAMALAEDHPDAGRLLSMARITTGRSGRTVAHGAVQLHGGIGMTAELAVGALFKRLVVLDAAFGSADHHLRHLAGRARDSIVSDLLTRSL